MMLSDHQERAENIVISAEYERRMLPERGQARRNKEGVV
jgi:hypothetical protein